MSFLSPEEFEKFAVPLNHKPLSPRESAKFEAGRDLGAELLESIAQMKAGQVQVAFSPAIEAREKTGLSQSQFAAGRRRKIEKCFSPNPRKVLCTRVPSKGLEAPVELDSDFVT